MSLARMINVALIVEGIVGNRLDLRTLSALCARRCRPLSSGIQGFRIESARAPQPITASGTARLGDIRARGSVTDFRG